MKFTLEEFNFLPSTNLYLKENAKDFLEGQVIVAKEQTGGRGRLGRTFFSPKNGLYFSVLICPKTVEDSLFLPIIAGIAVARGIKNLTGVLPKLKWPNDVLLNKKKICGILAEGTADGKVIMGIGINLGASRSYFDSLNLSHVSSILVETKKEPDRLELLNSILSEFDILLSSPKEEVIKLYRVLCITLGQIITTSTNLSAVAMDITPKGELIVKTQDNKIQILNSGEVSISGMY